MTFKATLTTMLLAAMTSGAALQARDTVPQAGDPKAEEILARLKAAHMAKETWKIEGISNVRVESDLNMNSNFTILFKKPNQYLISWSGLLGMSGKVWNSGSKAGFYSAFTNEYFECHSDKGVLKAATESSLGVGRMLLPLLLEDRELYSPLWKSRNAMFESLEEVDGVSYFVISIEDRKQNAFFIWISTDEHMIRKIEVLGIGAESEELDDPDIEEAVRSMGLEVTKENKQMIRKMLTSEKMQALSDKVTDKATLTESYHTATSPELTDADSDPKLPEDAKRRKRVK